MGLGEAVRRQLARLSLRAGPAQLPGLALGAAVGLAAFLLLTWVQPLRLHWLQVAEQVRQEQEMVGRLEEFARAQASSAAGQQQRERTAAQAQRQFPGELDVEGFLLELDQAAREAGLQLRQVRPQAPLAQAGQREVQLEVVTQGPFGSVQVFLGKLAMLQRLAVVQQLLLQVQPGGGLQEKLRISIYSQEPRGSGEANIQGGT